MQIRSMLLALLTIMWSTTIEAQVIQTLHEIGSAQFVVRDIEREQNARGLAPYPDSAVADMKVHESVHESILQSGRSVSTEPWEEEWNVPLPRGASAKDVLKSINDIWAAEGNWTNVTRADNSDISVWEFIDKTGNHWITTARAESSLTRNGCGCSIIITLKALGSSTSDSILATRKQLL